MMTTTFNPKVPSKYNRVRENNLKEKQKAIWSDYTSEVLKYNRVTANKKIKKSTEKVKGISDEKKEEIENKVNKLIENIKYEDKTDAIDIIEIAHKLGFVIGNVVLDALIDGFIIVEEGAYEIKGIKTDRLIGVNANRKPEWKRFIIANEIAHYMLQYKQGITKEIYAHREYKTSKNFEENEANFYADNLLMPKNKMTSKYLEYRVKESNYDNLISKLANVFKVTKKMIERRIKELELDGCE